MLILLHESEKEHSNRMYSEHFEQYTFKSDVAEAVINTYYYYNDAKVVSKIKRLVWTHKKLFDIHNV